jgi:hypothetical protein
MRNAEVPTLLAGNARHCEAHDRRKTGDATVVVREATRVRPTERLFHQCESAVEPAPQSCDHFVEEQMFRVSSDQPFEIRGLHERPASRASIQVQPGNDRTKKPAASIRSNDQ